MSNINDLKLSNLANLGYTGTVDDAELEYLGSLAYTGTLDDRRKQLWIDAGFANEKEFLLDKSYHGSLGDMQLVAFTDEAYYAPPEYIRQDYWRALNISELINVPYGLAGITPSGTITVQFSMGHTGTSTQKYIWKTSDTSGVNYRYVLMGSYNQSTGYTHYVNTVSTAWSQGTSTLNTNFWVLQTILDFDNYTHQAQFWAESDPVGTLRTSTPAALTQARIDEHGISDYIKLNVSNGFPNLCIKDVILKQGDTIVVYLPVDDGTGLALADHSGNGNDGFLTGPEGSWVAVSPYIGA